MQMERLTTVRLTQAILRAVATVDLRAATILAVAVVLSMCGPATRALGQCPAQWLAGEGVPGVMGGASAFVQTVLPLPNGDVLVGGAFTVAGKAQANNIARYTVASGTWSPLGAGVTGVVYAIAVLPNGDIVAGGNFTGNGAGTVPFLDRYNPTTGAWSSVGLAAGAQPSSVVRSLVVLPSGELIVAGEFPNVGAIANSGYIAKFSPATNGWSGLGATFDGPIYTLLTLPNSDIIAGGGFFSINAVSTAAIARYTTSSGAWSAVGGGTLRGTVRCLALAPGGDIIVGGNVTNNVPASLINGIARLNSAANSYSALGDWTMFRGVRGSCAAVTVLPSGLIVAGASFGLLNASPVAISFAAYNPTAGTWAAIGNLRTEPAVSSFTLVNGLGQLPGGLVVAGGLFTSASGITAANIAIADVTTNTYTRTNRGTNEAVSALAVLSGGDVILGGDFNSAGGAEASHIARYNPSSNVWSGLAAGISFGYLQTVNAMTVLPGGDLIVGGNFTTAGGLAVSNIARYSPSANVWSAMGTGAGNFVYALATLPSGDVVVGGTFTTAGGVPANRIARYNPVTNTWSALGVGLNGGVYTIIALPNGDVIAGGNFTSAGGAPANYVARWNGAAWSALGIGVNGWVRAITVLPGGANPDLVVGGDFTQTGFTNASRVARYNQTTGIWSPLGAGVVGLTGANVYALATLTSGDVVVGGNFTIAGGISNRNNIARYNPTTNSWSSAGTGANGVVRAVATLPGGDALIGGEFTVAGGNVSAFFARYAFTPLAPVITSQPQPVSACPPNSASFLLTVTGSGPLSYLWRKGGVQLNSLANPSAATAALTLTSITAGDAGLYDCVITNACGSLTSNSVVLTVTSCGPTGCSLADVAGGGPTGLQPDGVVDGSDFIAFINSFAVGDPVIDPLADVAGGGPVGLDPDGVIDGTDFIAFINAFSAGC